MIRNLISSAGFLTALTQAEGGFTEEDLENTVDIMPGFIVSDSKYETKYGILEIKTSWSKDGEGEDAEVTLGLFIKAVGNAGIENFHRDCFWQIAMSADTEADGVEM